MFTNVSSVDYVDAQRSWDDTDPRNEGEYLKGGFINAFPEELVTRLADGFEPDPRRSTMLYFQQSGGAIGRVASDAPAFAHRKSMANMLMFISWDLGPDDHPHIAWILDTGKSVKRCIYGFFTN